MIMKGPQATFLATTTPQFEQFQMVPCLEHPAIGIQQTSVRVLQP